MMKSTRVRRPIVPSEREIRDANLCGLDPVLYAELSRAAQQVWNEIAADVIAMEGRKAIHAPLVRELVADADRIETMGDPSPVLKQYLRDAYKAENSAQFEKALTLIFPAGCYD